MRHRSRAREIALKFLYMRDVRGSEVDGELDGFLAETGAPPPVRRFARELVRGVLADRDRIDGYLAAAAENWELTRMATVDRNVLRIAAWELLHATATPPRVVLNEAIELGKRYGSPRSGAFINGILDRIRRQLARAAGGESA